MGDDHSEALSLQGLKILGIFMIFLASMLGAGAPIAFAYFASSKDEDEETRKKKHRRIQIVMKLMTCVAIGIILATAMIHMIPEGINELVESGNPLFKEEEHKEEEKSSTNSTNSTDDHDDDDEHKHAYPFGFLFAMVSLMTIYFITTEINWYCMRQLKELKHVACDEEDESRMSALVKLYVLELGIAVHSVIIGLALGVTKGYASAQTLVIALCVHQAFEGLAVGSLTVAAELSWLKKIFFFAVFSLTTPIGTAVGMGVTTSAVAIGVVDCLAGGMLLFNALCDMLPHVFGAHEHHAHGPLPLAELHGHIHGNNNSDNAEGEMVSMSFGLLASSPSTDFNSPSSRFFSASAGNNPSTTAPDVQDHDDAAVPDTHDEHQDDESFLFRLACYGCMIVGCAIQSVLGIWA
jgi:zinc transporter ZupT